MTDRTTVAETQYGECGWPTIIGGVVFAHPVSSFGTPFINQLLPIRRATILERLAFTFFRVAPSIRPTPSKEKT